MLWANCGWRTSIFYLSRILLGTLFGSILGHLHWDEEGRFDYTLVLQWTKVTHSKYKLSILRKFDKESVGSSRWKDVQGNFFQRRHSWLLVYKHTLIMHPPQNLPWTWVCSVPASANINFSLLNNKHIRQLQEIIWPSLTSLVFLPKEREIYCTSHSTYFMYEWMNKCNTCYD